MLFVFKAEYANYIMSLHQSTYIFISHAYMRQVVFLLIFNVFVISRLLLFTIIPWISHP